MKYASAGLLLLAGAVVAAAYFHGRSVRRINATPRINTVNPRLTTVVEGQVAPARGAQRVYNGPVDFSQGSDIVGGYGGSARSQIIVRDSRFTSPQYVRPLLKGAI